MSTRRRSTQKQSQKTTTDRNVDTSSSTPSVQPVKAPSTVLSLGTGITSGQGSAAEAQLATTPDRGSVQRRTKTVKQGSQQVAGNTMGPPDIPKSATPARPQRQSKVDALAKKVWSAVAPGAGRKRTISANQGTTNNVPTTVAIADNEPEVADVQPPVSKKRKGAVETQNTVAGTNQSKAGRQSGPVQSHAMPAHPDATPANAGRHGRKGKAIPRVVLSVESDSGEEAGGYVPPAHVQVPAPQAVNAPAAPTAVASKPEAREPARQLTRAQRSLAQAPVLSDSAEVDADEVGDAVESEVSNSADEYAPDEDEEAYSEEDELDDPLSEDLEELEAQLREEAPVWTKEKDAKLPPVLRRKQPKKAVDLLTQLEGEAEQQSAGQSERSTSKTSQRQQLERPVWKGKEPARDDYFEADMEPWEPVKYTIPALEDAPWEENVNNGGPGDESDALSDVGTADFHPQAYEIKPPTTPGGVLSLKEQHEHIQDMIRRTFNRVESNLVFNNGFPDAVGRARFVFEAMRDSAKEGGHGGLYHRLGQDPAFARTLASLPNQRISTFRNILKKQTDTAAPAFYAVSQPGGSTDKVDWLFDHLKYIYPVVLEPVDKRSAAWAKPYQNPSIASTLRSCFFTGTTAVGNRDEARFVSSRPDREDEHEIPMPMLALVGAVLHASLSEWRTSIHKKGTFSADAFLDAYTEHVTLLTGIKTQNPRAYHTMMHRLYMEASGTITPSVNLANASDALAHVDFAGMDVD